MDAADILKAAVEKKVAFVPGESFHADGGGRNTARLNFSNATPDQITEGVTRWPTCLNSLIANRTGRDAGECHGLPRTRCPDSSRPR